MKFETTDMSQAQTCVIWVIKMYSSAFIINAKKIILATHVQSLYNDRQFSIQLVFKLILVLFYIIISSSGS